MTTQKTKLNPIERINLVKFIWFIILASEIAIYAMEQKLELQTPSYDNVLEQDLPSVLALQYIIDWVAPHTDNQNYLATKYKDLVEEYRYYEVKLKTIAQNPVASVMGGINYSMTLNKIEQKIRKKFLNMKKHNLLISHDEFENIKNDYFDSPHTDLTRIWGAEYLKHKINQSQYLTTKYNVPDYIIVLEDRNNIKINLSFYTRIFPIPLKLENGTIYFKKITGQPVASRHNQLMLKDLGVDSGIGFDDFSKPGNIIQDSRNNILYIVDTEFRSFKFPLSPELEKLLNYAAARFIYLHGNLIECTFELDL